jgi:hypothetical protein
MTWFEKKEFRTEISVDLPLTSLTTHYASPQDLLAAKHEEEYTRKEFPGIPLSAFSCGASTLRVVVKYLKDVHNLDTATIARLLNRNYQTIVTTHNAFPPELSLPQVQSAITIPLDVFSDRKIPPLESLVSHLKSLGFTYAEIALLIRRDQRTVWTAYHRKIAKEARP